jgi:glycosyltransferase involved in cell wall biosynthesis
LNVCTIIAKNYVAHARVLARSLTATHPGSRLWTLIIDDFAGWIDPAGEPFEILTPADVGCEEFTHMALRYSVLELSTAVKPWLLRHLMSETAEPVTYLDPDIKIYGSLEPLDRLAAEHGVVLIPHNSKPIPQDDRSPGQVDVMIAGIYNLGYVSLAPRPEVDRLLDWWSERLVRDCRVDPVWGYFVDQRWFDLAPGFLSDLAIVREPQYNVAYWNLHERRLEADDGHYLVDGHPLAFFHFSGFDPERPLTLSRHQNRIDVLEQPVLERLLAEYANEVMIEGHGVSRHWPYVYGALGDGTRLDDKLRALFDEFANEHDGVVASPFTLEGAAAFEAWIREQAPAAPPGISRALARIYEDRPDVRGAFPNLAGADRAAYLEWAAEHGADQEPLLARLVANGPLEAVGQASTEPGASEPSAPLRGAPWGVNVVGEFRTDTEGGEIARAMVSALDAGGVRALPVRTRMREPTPTAPAYPTAVPEDAPFTVNLFCLDPALISAFGSQVGPEFFAGRFSAGLWLAALAPSGDSLPDSISLLEEVWAPSAYLAGALGPVSPVPVHPIRIPVATQPIQPRTRAELGLAGDKFLFHSRWDYADGFELANPLAVVAAFTSAFAPGAGAGLVLDCIGAQDGGEDHARLRQAALQHPDITVLDGDRRSSEATSVTAACDGYVSLHRATAFGLPIAEAMWLGKPVVATGYSGNLDYMTPDSGRLVEHRLEAVGPGHDPYPPDATWAEPEVAHASELMRQLFDNQQAARELGAAGSQRIRETHSAQAASELVGRRLESIRATGRARTAADPIAAHPRALARLPLRLRQGPGPAAEGRFHGERERLRRVILRVMRPYTAYQQAINAEVVAALGELSREIVVARDETAAERADMLAAARRNESIAARLDGVEEIKRILAWQTDRSLYLALGELAARHADVGQHPGEPGALALTGFELRAFSQNGEDGVLAEILRRVGVAERYFVEFGVESGREGNCVFLADAADWRGLFMEADDEMFAELERKYAAINRVSTIHARVSAQNIEQLLAQAGAPAEPDVLSIDVDGQDYWIWSAIEHYRPRVAVIEYNSSLDPRRQLVQPDEPGHSWDRTEYYGASVGALRALGDSKGYRLVHTELSGVNAFFVRDDLAGAAFPAPDEVSVRGAPNYFQRGMRHPAARSVGRYLDLETGRLVRPDEAR